MKKASDFTFLGVLAAVFVLVPILTFTGRGQISYYEQRTLAPLPELTRESVTDGSCFTALDAFLSDHFCARDSILKADTAVRLSMGKPVVNKLVVDSGVLLNFHGYLSWSTGYLQTSAASRAAQYRALADYAQENGAAFCFLSLPYQTTYFADEYPSYMDDRRWNSDAMRGYFRTAMEDAGVPYLDLYEVFREEGFPREYYYETDHHCSLRGAFTAYQALLELLQERTPWDFSRNASPDDFEFVTLDKPFLGSFNRQLYGLWETSDRAELACVKADIPFTREDNGSPCEPEVFSLPGEDEPFVTYEVYMGGDVAETVIRTDRPERPDILIYGDSYTNVLETLLWTQADELRSLDYRHYSGMDLREYIAAYQPDIVICVRDETVLYSETENGLT